MRSKLGSQVSKVKFSQNQALDLSYQAVPLDLRTDQ